MVIIRVANDNKKIILTKLQEKTLMNSVKEISCTKIEKKNIQMFIKNNIQLSFIWKPSYTV